MAGCRLLTVDNRNSPFGLRNNTGKEPGRLPKRPPAGGIAEVTTTIEFYYLKKKTHTATNYPQPVVMKNGRNAVQGRFARFNGKKVPDRRGTGPNQPVSEENNKGRVHRAADCQAAGRPFSIDRRKEV